VGGQEVDEENEEQEEGRTVVQTNGQRRPKHEDSESRREDRAAEGRSFGAQICDDSLGEGRILQFGAMTRRVRADDVI